MQTVKVSFRTYCGLAGDLQEMLICEAESGHWVSCLYNRAWFKNWNLRRAKKRLLAEIKEITGMQPIHEEK